jgi:sigma-B regulation protein RsbU (phosphoserine phosphatase)
MYGYDDFFQPVGLAYQQFSANLWGAAFLMFGIYFPERAALDRRFPWAKWLLIAPILVLAIQDSASDVLAGSHIPLMRIVDEALPVRPGTMLFLNMFAIGGFFSFLGYKTFTATNMDMRRRLRLLYAGASVSMSPAFIVVLLNVLLWGRPETENAAIPLFLMLVGFPITLAYVILVERAMDVRVVIRHGMQYLLASKGITILQVLVSTILIVMVASAGGGLLVSVEVRILLTSVSIAGVLLIRQFAIKLRLWIDRRFFREAYDAEHILSDLADKVRTIVETRRLLETVTHRISDSLHVPRVAVLLSGGDAYRLAYAVGYPSTPNLKIPANTPDVEKAAREHLDAELLLPLSLNQNVLGFLSLGPKRSEEPYTSGDVRLRHPDWAGSREQPADG